MYKNVSISKFLSFNLFLDDGKIFPVEENIRSLLTDVVYMIKWWNASLSNIGVLVFSTTWEDTCQRISMASSINYSVICQNLFV